MTLGGSGSLGLYKYNYPDKRTKTLDDDSIVGVIGEMEKLQEASLGKRAKKTKPDHDLMS